jgi:hypothetical protein
LRFFRANFFRAACGGSRPPRPARLGPARPAQLAVSPGAYPGAGLRLGICNRVIGPALQRPPPTPYHAPAPLAPRARPRAVKQHRYANSKTRRLANSETHELAKSKTHRLANRAKSETHRLALGGRLKVDEPRAQRDTRRRSSSKLETALDGTLDAMELLCLLTRCQSEANVRRGGQRIHFVIGMC